MTNRYGTTDDIVDGDIAYADDMIDTLNNLRWLQWRGNNIGTSNVFVGVIGHSSTKISAINASGGIYNSTDEGVTWATIGGYTMTERAIIRACKADKTKAIAVEGAATAETAYSSDSGAIWANGGNAVFATDINDVAFSTAALIVVGGDDDAGAKHIVFSTDNGTTWTDATTAPSTKIYAVDMFDANTGYAVDSAGNIWKTTDAAVTWTDTTHNVSGTTNEHISIYAVSATLCIIAVSSFIELYDNTAGTVVIKVDVGPTNYNATLGIVKNDTGYYYVALSSTDIAYHPQLFRSTDSGTSWERSQFNGSGIGTDSILTKCGLTTIGTDVLIIPSNSTNGFVILRERQD